MAIVHMFQGHGALVSVQRATLYPTLSTPTMETGRFRGSPLLPMSSRSHMYVYVYTCHLPIATSSYKYVVIYNCLHIHSHVKIGYIQCLLHVWVYMYVHNLITLHTTKPVERTVFSHVTQCECMCPVMFSGISKLIVDTLGLGVKNHTGDRES